MILRLCAANRTIGKGLLCAVFVVFLARVLGTYRIVLRSTYSIACKKLLVLFFRTTHRSIFLRLVNWNELFYFSFPVSFSSRVSG